MPRNRKPKNAATTDTFGPKPSFSTMYGYDAPMIAATTTPAMTARIVNSRVPGGLGNHTGQDRNGSTGNDSDTAQHSTVEVVIP